MKSFSLKIWNDECARCTFYTVHCEDSQKTETDKLFERFIDDENHREDILILYNLLTKIIGNKNGAVDRYFRAEGAFNALPSNRLLEQVNYQEGAFKIRLLCYRVSPKIVILFNGGLKTARTAQASEFSLKFSEASIYTNRITEALRDNQIAISECGFYIEDTFYKNKEIII